MSSQYGAFDVATDEAPKLRGFKRTLVLVALVGVAAVVGTGAVVSGVTASVVNPAYGTADVGELCDLGGGVSGQVLEIEGTFKCLKPADVNAMSICAFDPDNQDNTMCNQAYERCAASVNAPLVVLWIDASSSDRTTTNMCLKSGPFCVWEEASSAALTDGEVEFKPKRLSTGADGDFSFKMTCKACMEEQAPSEARLGMDCGASHIGLETCVDPATLGTNETASDACTCENLGGMPKGSDGIAPGNTDLSKHCASGVCGTLMDVWASICVGALNTVSVACNHVGVEFVDDSDCTTAINAITDNSENAMM